MIRGITYGQAGQDAEKGSMKNATCYLHGLDLRPDLCHDCARCTPIVHRVIRLTDNERGAMERTYDHRGQVGFRLLRPIEPPVKLDPWANAG